MAVIGGRRWDQDMTNENRKNLTSMNLLYFSNFLLIGSLDKHFIHHSNGTTYFVVAGTCCAILALIFTSVMSRVFSNRAICIATLVIVVFLVLVDIA